MLASYVLRVLPHELAAGRLVGEVESVATGARATFHAYDDLVSFCRRDAAACADAPLPSPRVAVAPTEGTS